MNIWIVILFICLAVIFFQDIKYRTIHIIFPIVIFITSLTLLYRKVGINAYKLIVGNVALLIFIFLVLIGYMSVKKGGFNNPFKNYFGLGDLLFYLSIAPLFNATGYLGYFILSMLFAIITAYILKSVIKPESIPLAGFASLLLIGFFVFQLISLKKILIVL